jgi:hypothetical protein
MPIATCRSVLRRARDTGEERRRGIGHVIEDVDAAAVFPDEDATIGCKADQVGLVEAPEGERLLEARRKILTARWVGECQPTSDEDRNTKDDRRLPALGESREHRTNPW